MIKAEWTNKDALDLQPTCNQLATDLIRGGVNMPSDKEITFELKGAPKITNLWGDYDEEDIPHNLSQVLLDSGVSEEEIDDFECQNGFAYMEDAYNNLLEKFKATKKELEEKEITISAYREVIRLLK